MPQKLEIKDSILEILKNSPLKLTEQRKALINLIFANGNSHYTVEEIYNKSIENNLLISLATVYNTLNAFKDVGILKIVKAPGDKIYFDTNLKDHHHFFCKETGKLTDIKSSNIVISKLPKVPKGKEVSSINVIINIE